MTNSTVSHEDLLAQAAAIGVKRIIKHAGRFCILARIENGKALYVAQAKHNTVNRRAACHQPIFIEIPLVEA